MNRIVSALLLITFTICQGGGFTNPMLDSQGPYFARNVPNPGFWGSVPQPTANLFNSVWDARGFQQMYNLNSQSPFAGNRGSGFDTMTKVFNPIGPTRFDFFPTQSNFMTEGEIGAYTYDVNEPRMRNIVKNYFRFFNKDLDRLNRVAGQNTRFQDLNQNDMRKLQNPESFNYQKYFDGFDEANSTPVLKLPKMKLKTFFAGKPVARALGLDESFENFKKNLGISNEDLENGKPITPHLEKLQKLQTQLHRIERKLGLLENARGERKLADENSEQLVAQPLAAEFEGDRVSGLI
jgi:hypothetical protein